MGRRAVGPLPLLDGHQLARADEAEGGLHGLAGQGPEGRPVAAELLAEAGAGLVRAAQPRGLEVDHGPGAGHSIGEVDPAVEDLAARPVDEGHLAADDVRGADRRQGG